MTRNFETWLNSMQEGIATYEYYTDFKKVGKNTDKIRVSLNILNSLIGSKNIEADFRKIMKQYPEVWACIPILLAERKTELYGKREPQDAIKKYVFNAEEPTLLNIDDCVEFMRETGLFDFLENRMCKCLVDYVYGVETGLDTHTRKNRSGKLMENLVKSYLEGAGLVKNKDFKEQKVIPEYDKKFDFVVYGKNTTYVIETNYYRDGGSKPREICLAYTLIYRKKVDGFQFIWITDGQGWKKEVSRIRDCFKEMGESLWNIEDLKNGFVSKLK